MSAVRVTGEGSAEHQRAALDKSARRPGFEDDSFLHSTRHSKADKLFVVAGRYFLIHCLVTVLPQRVYVGCQFSTSYNRSHKSQALKLTRSRSLNLFRQPPACRSASGIVGRAAVALVISSTFE